MSYTTMAERIKSVRVEMQDGVYYELAGQVHVISWELITHGRPGDPVELTLSILGTELFEGFSDKPVEDDPDLIEATTRPLLTDGG